MDEMDEMEGTDYLSESNGERHVANANLPSRLPFPSSNNPNNISIVSAIRLEALNS
jgi:hypothetical protein